MKMIEKIINLLANIPSDKLLHSYLSLIIVLIIFDISEKFCNMWISILISCGITIIFIALKEIYDSKNKDIFVNLAKENAGIDVDIIDGEKESHLGFIGVLQGLEKEEEILVIDIGGGSTEFIIGDKDGIKFAKSENVGALRMTEKFLKEDPVNENEFKDMSNFISNEIKYTLEHIKNDKVKKLVGIGGTITSLSAMNQELEVYSMEKIHNSRITLKQIEFILQNLKKMTLSDKKTLKGLQPKRADIITAGVEILHTIMKNLEIDEITVSEYDNLEGLMCQKSKNMS